MILGLMAANDMGGLYDVFTPILYQEYIMLKQRSVQLPANKNWWGRVA